MTTLRFAEREEVAGLADRYGPVVVYEDQAGRRHVRWLKDPEPEGTRCIHIAYPVRFYGPRRPAPKRHSA
ncbi:MAG: hypothetical protein RLZZ127_1520 [Planctomycetota bacterium]|jgi:hypothetical protein